MEVWGGLAHLERHPSSTAHIAPCSSSMLTYPYECSSNRIEGIVLHSLRASYKVIKTEVMVGTLTYSWP